MARWTDVEDVLKQLKVKLGEGGPPAFRSEEMAGCDAILLEVLEMLEEGPTISNAPLAWEDLRNLVGQPIYIVQLDDKEGYWALLYSVDDTSAVFASALAANDFGRKKWYNELWVAYRYPLEEEDS